MEKCLDCGVQLAPDAVQCSSCGWSWLPADELVDVNETAPGQLVDDRTAREPVFTTKVMIPYGVAGLIVLTGAMQFAVHPVLDFIRDFLMFPSMVFMIVVSLDWFTWALTTTANRSDKNGHVENTDSNDALGNCSDCGGTVSKRALACPHCGAPKPAGQYSLIPTRAAVSAIALVWLCFGVIFFADKLEIDARTFDSGASYTRDTATSMSDAKVIAEKRVKANKLRGAATGMRIGGAIGVLATLVALMAKRGLR